jgi:hypothetical protein
MPVPSRDVQWQLREIQAAIDHSKKLRAESLMELKALQPAFLGQVFQEEVIAESGSKRTLSGV